MSGKPLAGHHLMRVRVRNIIFEKLQEAADRESGRLGENVTVSDLVRAACYNYLLAQEGLENLESYTEAMEGSEEVTINDMPMLE